MSSPPLQSQATFSAASPTPSSGWRPAPGRTPDFEAAEPSSGGPSAGLWRRSARSIGSIFRYLRGVDRVRDLLLENTQRFARGLPANNAMLWGARGMGKSSLVKAVHAVMNAQNGVERTR